MSGWQSRCRCRPCTCTPTMTTTRYGPRTPGPPAEKKRTAAREVCTRMHTDCSGQTAASYQDRERFFEENKNATHHRRSRHTVAEKSVGLTKFGETPGASGDGGMTACGAGSSSGTTPPARASGQHGIVSVKMLCRLLFVLREKNCLKSCSWHASCSDNRCAWAYLCGQSRPHWDRISPNQDPPRQWAPSLACCSGSSGAPCLQ
jgi:hypothetical protein